ncbi:aspartate/glutamate racemase family protein [Permianibacter sp. IMCC34836]|uniref:aspartate/glutamate racemase family protein n=1 Tax=Permianibacter fluminis TaxID=2738515 RepID=UPI001556AF2A|nr:aspartate/glutamate racemase family protein [Permianibacter fluminis]NQD35912.1 aspartate/glutamate racemase family protein [Permianibacter fluminis]
MRTIGLIGGMSWESSAIYYRLLNEQVRHRLGGLHSAQCLLYSVDFADIEQRQRTGDWDGAGQILATAGQSLQRAGAEALLLCTNTMHKVADQISSATTIPLLHIVDATAQAIQRAGLNRVLLLATRFTMEQAFYRERMQRLFGVELLIPDAAEREDIHRIIYQELCLGVVRPESKQRYLEIIQRHGEAGGQGVILGCTEITMLIQPGDTRLPQFDSTALHAQAAVDWMLQPMPQATPSAG